MNISNIHKEGQSNAKKCESVGVEKVGTIRGFNEKKGESNSSSINIDQMEDEKEKEARELVVKKREKFMNKLESE